MINSENVLKEILILKAEKPEVYDTLLKACAQIEKYKSSRWSHRSAEQQVKDARELEEAKLKEIGWPASGWPHDVRGGKHV